MGQEQSSQQQTGGASIPTITPPTSSLRGERIPVKCSYKDVNLTVPYEHLGMIKLLQAHYKYEVKGTLYFDHSHTFTSFEIRTDVDPLFSTGASDWKISFHTHPDKTAEKFGIRYYSPPSVDDVMEIYDHSMSYKPDSVSGTLGEVSIVFTNEGIYVMQVDREAFTKSGFADLKEEEQEDRLNDEFNTFITQYIKDRIKKIYELEDKGKPNFENPQISYEQFSRMLKGMCGSVVDKFGFRLGFYDWHELNECGLILSTSAFYVNRKLAD